MNTDSKRSRILIVDDEPLVLEIFASVLFDEGYRIEQAQSAVEALELLETNHYDALLSDVRLSPFDGFEIAQIARKRNPNLGVLLLTGAPEESDIGRAQQLAMSYLVKPIGMDQLRSAVNQLFRDGPIGSSSGKNLQSAVGTLRSQAAVE